MKRMHTALIAAFIAVTTAAPLPAQMDMLPQIFRDLPPELQEGLPQQMSFEEYGQLNRNVDFFTMFMSMWVPGYGFFQVEKPGLALSVAGARALGYGMMGVAVWRQWDNIRDIMELSVISDSRYLRFIGNLSLFAGGIVLNGMGWAVDVAGAYHIAKAEKSWVIYKYGYQETISSVAEEERRVAFIRKLVLQGDRSLEKHLLQESKRYLAEYPRGAYAAEVYFYLGTSYQALYDSERAFLNLARVLLFYPDSRFAADSRRAMAELLHENRAQWAADWQRLMKVVYTETENQQDPGGALFERYLEQFAKFETYRFQRLFVEEALRFSLQYGDDPAADEALWNATVQLRRSGRFQDAVITLTELVARFPESEHAAPALLEIGKLLIRELSEGTYAGPFLERAIERYPDSAAAEEARALLSQEL